LIEIAVDYYQQLLWNVGWIKVKK